VAVRQRSATSGRFRAYAFILFILLSMRAPDLPNVLPLGRVLARAFQYHPPIWEGAWSPRGGKVIFIAI
jgi:hypothetical protein